MTDDLISRSELLKHCTTIRVTYHCQGADEWDDYEAVLVKDVKAAPTVSPDEVRGVAHWVTEKEAIDANDYSLRDTCSVCGHCDWDCTESANFKYCPNCGARMRGVSGDV